VSLQIEQLCSTVDGVCHLQDVSLHFDTDSFNVLLGPARAGKTSLLRLIAGLEQPSSGRILRNGEDITQLEVRRRNIAFVYQEFVNYPTLTVFENIASPLRVRSQKQPLVDHQVHAVAKLLGIEAVLDRYPPSLSGGQQQRVAIARALTKDADIVLLDEPLANLDYKLREDLRCELPRLFTDSGKIVLYATTDPNEAFLLGGHTVVLDEGRVIQVGSPATVFAAPECVSAARIMSEFPLNLLPARIRDGECTVPDQTGFSLPSHMRSQAEGDYTLGIRAELFSNTASENKIVAFNVGVSGTEFTGNETITYAALSGEPCVAVTSGAPDARPERMSRFYVDPNEVFLFDSNGRTVAWPQEVTP